ncbi:hypothetical protein BS78_03G031600 [Paspalum vaginatum]|nr:hypothetical protein BS78_03G031600 [Paspalum vaginatum]
MLQDVAMEPQPGSPTSPPFSPVTASFDSATATTPSQEMLAPDEPQGEGEGEEEEAVELESARKSTSSSSSSSSASSAESLCDIDVVELGGPLVAAVLPEGEDGKATPVQSAEVELDERATPEDERVAPVLHSAEVRPDVVRSAEVKPDDWATWPEPPPPAVDDSFSSTESAAEAPQVQTVSPVVEGAGAAGNEFDPQRIPASVFQPRTSVSQAEWSMASNESLFSIQGACEVGGPYASSRSHFDFFYDEAMAAAASAEADSKLPTVTEGTESESKEFPVPGSARSADCAGSANDPKAAVFRRHESGSGGSSSNFSFAFPILAETSPKKKDVLASTALYQPLEKEIDLPPPLLEPPVSAFMEMTTEEERRSSANTGCCCCCGCCWFDCSCCCRWQWWRCGCCRCSCSCSCPTFCRCSWCLCF